MTAPGAARPRGGSSAELACAVLSFCDEAGLVDAVRSVLSQATACEVVVVNSGGGDPGRRLAEAAIDVPVVNVRERLYPGAARNLGIRHTSAQFVSFLAADCLAAPGWVDGRLREHRAGHAAVASCLANADPENLYARASLLMLDNRLLTHTPEKERLYYGLSYDRALFDHYGLFDETLRAGEDTEFNRRLTGRVPIVRADDVRTVHRYPTALRPFISEAFRRGRLQALMLGRIEATPPQSKRVARRAVGNIAFSLRRAAGAPEGERRQLLRAWPLVVPGGLAYAAGATAAGIIRPNADGGAPLATAARSPR